MKKMYKALFVVIGFSCFYSSSYAMYNSDKRSVETYLCFLPNGPLKRSCETCKTGCLFKTREEKARNYIINTIKNDDPVVIDERIRKDCCYCLCGIAAAVIRSWVKENPNLREAVRTLLPDESAETIEEELNGVQCFAIESVQQKK
jgi:hypothetical protein